MGTGPGTRSRREHTEVSHASTGALIGGVIGSTTELCLDSCTAADARSGAITAGVILGGSAVFLLGGVIGALIRSDRSSSASFNDRRISVGPRVGAPGFTVNVRF